MHPEDLSDLESRLSAWKPTAEGLDADAMLFAAGRASASPRARPLWPVLTALLAAVALALGAWAAVERSGRLALAAQLQKQMPAPVVPGEPVDPPATSPVEGLGPNNLLSTHRALEQGLAAWSPGPLDPPLPPAPAEPTFQLGHREALLAP